jgi:hypothetical protein
MRQDYLWYALVGKGWPTWHGYVENPLYVEIVEVSDGGSPRFAHQ